VICYAGSGIVFTGRFSRRTRETQFAEEAPMRTAIKSIPARKMTLLIRTLFACLVMLALSAAPIATWAGPAQTKAEKASAKWKAAKAAVAAAKEKLADAQKALQNAMTAVAKSGGKTTAAQEEALAQGRAAVARAE